MERRAFLGALAAVPLASAAAPQALLDDGGWCWFEDERSLVIGDTVVFGTVATGYKDPAIAGQIRVTQHNWKTGKSSTFVLHDPARDVNPKQWIDDHNSPAFLRRPDGRLIAFYARHGTRNEIHYRLSTRPDDASAWEPERIFIPSESSRVTYSNLFYLAKEKRTYDFFRGIHNSYKPSYAFSDDLGETWKPGGVVINVPHTVRHRPYAKYCSNNTDTVHIAYTEGHPRDFDNSIYHVFYRDGRLHRSDGTPIRSLAEGLKSPDEGTRLFAGNADAVAWTTDFHLIGQNQLLLVYTVQVDRAGQDHRFRLAHFDGKQWHDHEIAKAGTRLYPGEDDYTGLAALDPAAPNTLFISTNVDPATGRPTPHREIYRGRTRDFARVDWSPVTANSAADNLRPMIPIAPGRERTLLWLRGQMRTYTNYSFEVVGFKEPRT